MNINRRIYTRYFSQHLALSVAGIVIFALSYAPFARVHIQYAVNQNLVFTLRYLGLFLLMVGFRGNYPSLKVLHKTIAVFMGIIPTLFMILATLFVIYATLIIPGLVWIFMAEFKFDLLPEIVEGLIYVTLYAYITVNVWLLIGRSVFAQYKYPHDLDAQSQFASVAVLLMFFGFMGAHRFFVGRIVSGVLFLATMGFFGVGVIVDGIMLTLRRFKDSEGNVV